ncbi:hypothetical protein ACQ4PT_018448 [Festuca glaucescens]
MSAAAARVFRGCRALMANSFSSSAAAGSKRPASAVKPPKVTTKADATEAKNMRGIMRPVPVSEALSKFPAAAPRSPAPAPSRSSGPTSSRPPANKREILCDEKLKSIFAGRDKIGMMEVTKLLSPHFIKTN